MLQWLSANLGTILICLALMAAVGCILRSLIRQKKVYSISAIRCEAEKIFSSSSFNSGVIKRSPFTKVCLRI